MAELASGAVSSLLGLLRNEALLLSRVGSDSEFIKEEMESMHSFLEHLARTAPPAGGGGHDEQVHTWMKQVRDLAHDCSNCIDLYLRRGDPAVYRARAGRWRYLWWASWLVQRMVAQHNVAIRLRELKERARDVGNRRLWYGVEIPRKEEAAPLPSSSSQAAGIEYKEDEDYQIQAANGSDPRQRALEPRLVEEYCAEKLVEKLANWQELQAKTNNRISMASIAIVAPDDTKGAGTVAQDSLRFATKNFKRTVWVNLSALHFPWDLPLLPSEILSYILYECEQQKQHEDEQQKQHEDEQQKQHEDEQQKVTGGQGEVKPKMPIPWEGYSYKARLRYEILNMFNYGEIRKQIDEIRNKVREVDKGEIGGVDRGKVEENKCLGIFHHALRLVLNTLVRPLSSEGAIEETASLLKDHMETGESNPKTQIHLDNSQYEDILRKVFPTNKPLQSQQIQEATTSSATTLSEAHIKEIIHNHKITLDIILGLLPKPQLLEGTSTKEQAIDAAASVSKEISGEATGAAAAVIKETKEKTKEVSEEVTSAIASAVIEETKEKTETSGEVSRDIAAAVVNQTKEKLKELSAEVTSAIAAAVIKETKEKMKEMDITGAIAAAVIEEAKEKMKGIVSGEVEATSDVAAAITETIKETLEKMSQIPWRIWGLLYTKGIVDKIKPRLKNKKTLIILQDDKDYVSAESRWEESRNALNLLGCAPGSTVIVSTKNSEKAKDFCYPPGEPITCSLVGLYHDTVLQLTKPRMINGNDGDIPGILREILAKCHPHEFCMKIFVYALYTNPNRSYEELCKLNEDLAPAKTLGSKAKNMIKFSYKDLPREHKTCLLYLAIFPQGHNIKRSTLIGRWVTEGLITKQDWATAVHHAEQCFDTLIKKGLILPHDIGAAGKVKSCMVGDQVHGFITEVAEKEHILDARLSDLWARHFSIFSGLRLRASDGIEKFVYKLPKYSPQLPLLKVLDLEGTQCFDKNHYLRDICNKMLLLKYLSLRGTNVRHLPSEINNLHELEVLDIRETMVPERATRNILLLKLRRFLASRVDPNSRLNDKSARFPVQIPFKIEKMENLEILSNVRASGDGSELKEIRHLWQLRKLNVVIEDRNNHLEKLLRAIGDLKDCLQSLSITISYNTRTKSTLSNKEMRDLLRQSPKHLESLSINGVTQSGQLLELLAKGSDELAKVTLTGTLLEEGDLVVLAVLPKLHSVRLRSNAYNGRELTFKKDVFPQLKYFLVEGSNKAVTDIKFEDGAATELEKIVLSSTNIRFLSGIENLPKLKELELEGNQSLLSFSQDKVSPDQSTESGSAEQNTKGEATL
ncbi:disease resistance protein RGA4-like [Triticum aestivum]|uniref:disease resistance protein RGA4-like n=1 Tax=Triticum aestivum TaxID=4565 RepID=UPI001D034E42|nr:disease resistance protein RGA4-like [Triticum aestivum]